MVKVKTKTKQKPQTFDVSTMKAISKCTCRLIKLRRNVKQLNATSCLFSFECLLQGRIQDFFRRGCTRLLLYFNTNKAHSFCFFAFLQNTSCIRKPQVISGEGGRTPCTLPLDPPLYLPTICHPLNLKQRK